MFLTKIHEEHDADFFPFHFFADAWAINSKPVVGFNLPVTLQVFENSSVKYYADKKDKQEQISALVGRFLNGLYEKIEKKSSKLYSETTAFFKQLEKKELSQRSNREIALEFREFYRLMQQVNGWGMAYALLEYPESQITAGLEEYLQEQARKTGATTPPVQAFAILTSPTKGTTLRELQKKILQIASKIRDDAEAEKLFSKNAEELESELPSKFPHIYHKITELTKQYCWINYGYTGPAMPISYFISQIKQELKEDARAKLAEIEGRDTKTAAEQKRRVIEFAVDERHYKLFKLASDLVVYKNYRKEMLYHFFYLVEPLHRQIAKRLGLTPLQARYFTLEEICQALEDGIKLDDDTANQRREFSAYLIDGGKANILGKKEAGKWMALVEKEKQPEQANELKGNCACPGVVRGRVRIVLKSIDIGKVKKGDILVSFSTNPNMVPGMKSAGAVVTEVGGVASHAAIVTREFNIPCIVGAKHATRILRENELVEVDATHGIVRRI